MSSEREQPFFIEGHDRAGLFAVEAQVIHERRRQAFPPEPVGAAAATTPTTDTNTLPDDLVGLALSGGGLRSAAYNLGLAQAFSRFGLLRYIDYLCSVSGGGYIAGHISTAASRTPSFHESAEARFGVTEHERLDSQTYRFRHLGEYLLNYASFIWRYVISTFGSLGLFLGVLGAIGAILGMIWRSQDLALVRQYKTVTRIDGIAEWFGLNGEAMSAVLPSVGLFAIFLLLALVRHMVFGQEAWPWLKDGSRAEPKFAEEPTRHMVKHATYIAVGLIVLFICLPWLLLHWMVQYDPLLIGTVTFAVAYPVGMAVLLVTRLFDGSSVHGALWIWILSLAVSLAVFLGNGESRLGPAGVDKQLQSQWTWMLLLSAVVSLLPLIASGQMARSAQNDAPFWKQWLFRALIGLATVCVPFFVVHWMSRENISGYATHRPPEIQPEDVLSSDSFFRLMKPDNHDEVSLVEALSIDADKIVDGDSYRNRFEEIVKQETNLSRWAQSISGVDSWHQYQNSPLVNPIEGTAHFITVHAGQNEGSNVFKYLRAWSEHEEKKKEFLHDYVNPVMSLNDGGESDARDLNDDDAFRLTRYLMHLVVLRAAKGQEKAAPPAIPPKSKETPDETDKPQIDLTHWQPESADALHKSISERVAEVFRTQPEEGRVFKQLWNQATRHNLETDADLADAYKKHPRLTRTERAEFNRLLMEYNFPETFRSRRMITTTIVPPHDQRARFGWLVFWVVACSLGLAVNFNHFSPFYTYYRDRLKEHFIDVFGPSEAPSTLAGLKPWTNGGPYPLMVASQFYLGRVTSGLQRRDESNLGWTTNATLRADSSRVQPWIFSPLYCGGYAAGFQSTASYCHGKILVEDAIAMSGAALTPFMVDNIFFSGLMAALNLRIGQWLPRPARVSHQETNLTARGYRIADEVRLSAIDPQNYEKLWKMALVADGGFHDFFGLEELLLRRCRVIILSDAGCNNGRFEFGALADVIRLARERHGIHILDLDNERPPDLALLKRNKEENRQPLHHICLRIVYPPVKPEDGVRPSAPTEALLVYTQMSLTGREQLDLQQFRNSHPNFPDEPITNQFFDPKQVESYRQLGYEVGRTVCSQLQPSDPRKVQPDVGQLACDLVRGYLAERTCYAIAHPDEAKFDGVVDNFDGCNLVPVDKQFEDIVSQAISVYLTGGDPTAFLNRTLAGWEEVRRQWVVAIARSAISLLREHRTKLGYPYPAPFKAGGRRLLIRAAAVFCNPQSSVRKNALADFEKRIARELHAYFALSQLVFRAAGPEAVAEWIVNSQLARPAQLQPTRKTTARRTNEASKTPKHRLQPMVQQCYQRMVEALKDRDQARLKDLLKSFEDSFTD